MALLAEELVQEWLHRDGYFTIRGLKVGVGEMDLLAVKVTPNGVYCRHLEVQASVNPISYICGLPKALRQSTGRGAANAKTRSESEQQQGVDEWIQKKFREERKRQVLQQLCPGVWTEELVVHVVRHPGELELIRQRGVQIHRLNDIIKDLVTPMRRPYTAAGSDFVELLVKPAGKAADGTGNP